MRSRGAALAHFAPQDPGNASRASFPSRGYTDILSSFYTDALRKGGILLMILGVAVCAAGRFLRGD